MSHNEIKEFIVIALCVICFGYAVYKDKKNKDERDSRKR